MKKGKGGKAVKRALVLWTREDKTSVVNMNQVPAAQQFENAVTTVLFEGDKKWYPAKVIMISDNDEALTEKRLEVEREIGARQAAAASSSKKRKRTAVPQPADLASEQDIARALGQRPPIPKHLVEAQVSAKNSKKDAETNKRISGMVLDTKVQGIKRNLMSQLNKGANNALEDPSDDESNGFKDDELDGGDGEDPEEGEQGHGDEDGSEGDSVKEDKADDADDAEAGSGEAQLDDSTSKSKCGVFCNCIPCQTLQKYGSDSFVSFLTDLTNLFPSCEKDTPKYLKLLNNHPKSVKLVELTVGSGVMIPKTTKDQLKVDFKNKSSPLIRETLYALYGKDTLKSVNVTARGNKSNSYGIEDHVLKALASFVNRNVDAKSSLSLAKVCSTINKRALEWRHPSSPKDEKQSKSRSKSKATPKASQMTKKSVATNKISPAKSPAKSPVKSPAKSPLKSPLKFPVFEVTPTEPTQVNPAPNNEGETEGGSVLTQLPSNIGPPHTYVDPQYPDWYFDYRTNQWCKTK